jgi:hypothetical protein
VPAPPGGRGWRRTVDHSALPPGTPSDRDPWETALEGLDLIVLDPGACRLRLDENQRLSGTVHGRDYPEIIPYMPFPLTHPADWVSLVAVTDPDSDGRRSDGGMSERVELGVLPGLDGLDADSRDALAEALHLRYFMPRVLRIVSAWDEAPGQTGAVHWQLETDRGEMRMRMPNLFEGIQELEAGRLILSDGEGNRAEIPSVAALDPQSRRLLDRYYWF